jgi:uncharacterized protein (DUF2384 family)
LRVARLKGGSPRTNPNGRFRISRVFENTVDLNFEGDSTNALNWLTTPKKAFENQTPLAYSRTELGAREVENTWADWSTASSVDLRRLLAGW